MREIFKIIIISIIIQQLIFSTFVFANSDESPNKGGGAIGGETYSKQLDKYFRLDDAKIPEQFRYLYLLRYLAVKDLLKSRASLHRLVGNRNGFDFRLTRDFVSTFGGKNQPDIQELIDDIYTEKKQMSDSDYYELLTIIVNISLNITAYDKAIKFLSEEFWADDAIKTHMTSSTKECKMVSAGFQGTFNVCKSDFSANSDKYIQKHHGEKIKELLETREYLLNILGRFLSTKLNGTLFDSGDDLYRLVYKEALSLGYFPSLLEPLKPVSDDFGKAVGVIPAYYDPNPHKADTDGDGLLDGQEDQNKDGIYSRDGDDGFNYTDDDETEPTNPKTNDIYPFNDYVYRHGTNEHMPTCFDKGEQDCLDPDKDGLPNFVEREQGTNFYKDDTDQDGILDGADSQPTIYNKKRYRDSDGDGIPDNFFGKMTYATNRLYNSEADFTSLFKKIKPLVDMSLLVALKANDDSLARLVNNKAFTYATDTSEIDKLVYFSNLTVKAEELFGKEYPFIFSAKKTIQHRIEASFTTSEIRRWTLNILAGLSLGAAIYFSGGTALIFLSASSTLFTVNSRMDYTSARDESALISDFYLASAEMSNYAQYDYSKQGESSATKYYALDIGLSVLMLGPLSSLTKFRIIPNTAVNAAKVAKAGQASKPIVGGKLLKVEAEGFSLSKTILQVSKTRFGKTPFIARLSAKLVQIVKMSEARALAKAAQKQSMSIAAVERGTKIAAQLEKIPVVGRSISQVGGKIVTNISQPGFKKYMLKYNVTGVGYMMFVDYVTMGSTFYEKKEDVLIDCALEVYLISGFTILGAAVPMLSPQLMAKMSGKEKLLASLNTFKKRVPWGIGIGMSGAGFAQGTAYLKDQLSGTDAKDIEMKERLLRGGYDATFLAFSSNARYQATFFLTQQLPQQYPALKHFIFDIQIANEFFGNWHYAKLLDVSGLRFNDTQRSDYSLTYPTLHIEDMMSDKSQINLPSLIKFSSDNYRGESNQRVSNVSEFTLDPYDRDILINKMRISGSLIDEEWQKALQKADSYKSQMTFDELRAFIQKTFRNSLCLSVKHKSSELNMFCGNL